MSYNTDGKANYPWFIKTQLHAELVKEFRPKSPKTRKEYQKQIEERTPFDDLIDKERIIVMEQLHEFIEQHLNPREKTLVHKCICGPMSRFEFARQSDVSQQRMKVVHQNCLKKMRRFLIKIGIRKFNDI